MATGLWIAVRNRVGARTLFDAAAWWFTFKHASISFDPVSVHSLSFTAPSADVLMYVIAAPTASLTFDLGLIPGVVAGAALGALTGKGFRLEGFQSAGTIPRYIAGGCLMGFGGMLAGGCAVGAGVSGASVFALTAWIVLWSMWFGAALTDRLIDRDEVAHSVHATRVS